MEAFGRLGDGIASAVGFSSLVWDQKVPCHAAFVDPWPRLASLASVGAPDVRRAVREVLEAQFCIAHCHASPWFSVLLTSLLSCLIRLVATSCRDPSVAGK